MYIPYDLIRDIALLIDIPLFIFLSGWSVSYKEYKFSDIVKRIISNYIPYVIMIFFLIALLFLFDKVSVPRVTIYNWLTLKSFDSLGWHVVMGSMWFLPVYFVIYSITPIFQKLIKNNSLFIFTIIILILMNAIFTFTSINIQNLNIYTNVTLRYFTFYILFFILGMYFSDKYIALKEFLIIILGLLFIFLLYLGYYGSFDVQSNKFPPSVFYLIISLFSIFISIYIKNFELPCENLYKKNVFLKFLNYSGRNSLTIYLYQGFGGSVIYLLASKLIQLKVSWYIIMVLCFIVNILVTYLLTIIFTPINKNVNRFIELIYSKNSFKFILIIFSVFILVNMIIIVSPERYGDGFEYIYMLQALENHLTPDVLPQDIMDAQIILNQNNIVPYSDAYSGFFESLSGKMYSYHFFGYPLVVLPVKLVLKLFDINTLKSFQITNAIFYIISLWITYLYTEFDEKKKKILVLMLAVNPIIWYLRWTHPEVVTYSLIIISLVMFSRKKLKLSMLFSAIASMQNPPLVILMAIYLIFFIKQYKKDYKIKDAILMIISCIPAGIPSIFYYCNYATPNLIMKVGSAGIKYVSIQKIYDLLFDLNMGIFPYLPILLILFIYLLTRKLFKKDILSYIFAGGLLLMIILSAQTSNWNHGCSGLNRYAVWMIPIIIYYVILYIDIEKFKSAVAISLILSWFIVYHGGGFIPKLSHVEMLAPAKTILNNMPFIYSPDYEIFAERVLSIGDTTYADKFPIVYINNGNVMKALTDYKGLQKMSKLFEVIDKKYYNKLLLKFSKNPDKVMYINFKKNQMSQFTMSPLPDEGFRYDLNIENIPTIIGPNSNIQISANLKNISNYLWDNKFLENNKYAIGLSYHWLDSYGQVVIHDGLRTYLESPIKPGDIQNININILTPSNPGRYILEFDMIQENVAWFEDKGSNTIEIAVEIK
ncbi:acyltransferase family protein [Oxobacter pfennigii]|uniref:Acyltransferase family protein n=2 Tax=Oxobacter pfennigii TaxID=36849 RepID=A0A0P8WZ20_9CLOT|nr:acyltransferase family protein [Oxobacter pfennigii]